MPATKVGKEFSLPKKKA
ncbi:hypothetical protein SAMN04487898_10939 [Pedobacter sp. ok626]|nr:hypothetical protein SAMN04487898_10939 [Pedobacter sp. ok626]